MKAIHVHFDTLGTQKDVGFAFLASSNDEIWTKIKRFINKSLYSGKYNFQLKIDFIKKTGEIEEGKLGKFTYEERESKNVRGIE